MKTLTWVASGAVAGLVLVACGESPAARKHAAEVAQQTRLAWQEKNLVGAYEKVGRTDPKWDDAAKAALTEAARLIAGVTNADEDASSIISVNCSTAVNAGCNDAVIRYYYIRYCMDPSQTAQQFADAYFDTAMDMENSTAYPPIRKYWAWLRAARQTITAYGYGSNIPPRVLTSGMWSRMEVDLMGTLGDETLPPEDAYETSRELLSLWKISKEHYATLWQEIEGQLSGKRAKAPAVLLLKGEVYIDMAWQARGGGYANSVSSNAMNLFGQRLGMAEEALNKAWELDPEDPRIAVRMIAVAVGLGKDRDQMELWFNRAMKLDPNDYDACNNKLWYIEPAWYGSIDEMLAFGRQCVQNNQWGGHVPLILMDAHQLIQRQFTSGEEQTNYWNRPEVWSDLKSAFDRFFELNPTETGWYYNYAWYAYHAGQWDTFNDLVPKLGNIDYQFFGGEEIFDRMVAQSKENAHRAQGKTNSVSSPPSR